MQSVNNVQHWIEAGNDFLWLQKPGEENVTCYNLGGLTNHLDNESVLICPFDANSPFIFKVDSKVSTEVPDLSGLKISCNPDIETKTEHKQTSLCYSNRICFICDSVKTN